VTNVELVRTLHEIWNTGKLELIESVYVSDFAGYWPASSEVPVRVESKASSRTRAAFPDWHEQVIDVFGHEEKVTSRYVSTGTHSGPIGVLSRRASALKYRRFQSSAVLAAG
jgi:hypothetical protein